MNQFVRSSVSATGKDEAMAVREDVHVLRARIPQLKLEPAGVRRWGETNEANLREYMEDPETIAKAARDYKPR